MGFSLASLFPGSKTGQNSVKDPARKTTAQLQREAITNPPNLGATSLVGLPALDWGSIQRAIGSVQNVAFGTSQNAGGDFATIAGNAAGQTLGGTAANGASGLFTDEFGNPSSPVMGVAAGAAGALAGGLIGNAAREGTFNAALDAGNNLNLQPVQNFLGQTQSVLHKLKDTFGFLFSAPPGLSQDTTLTARVTPLGQDSNIKYSVAPTIPTLTGHDVIWAEPENGTKAVTGLRKSQSTATRMSFRLDARNTIMSLLVNPKQLQVSRSQTISNAVSRSGFIVNPTGPGEFDINITGVTAGMYESGGLSTRESNTVSYSNLLLLYNFFLNNGYILDDEVQGNNDKSDTKDINRKVSSAVTPPDPRDNTAPIRRINSMSYVTIEWQKWIWWGYFKSFKISDNAENPYTRNFQFSFRVCHETDLFKIDNMRGDSRQKPPVTGHVDKGYSAERALAVRSVGGEAPNNLENPNPVHKNVALSNFQFTDKPTAPLLDPRVPLNETVTTLNLMGFRLSMVSGDNGNRYTGQGPDGSCIDVGRRGNETSLIVNSPGASPVSMINVSSHGPTDDNGDPTVKGVISSGGQQYGYSVKGSLGGSKAEAQTNFDAINDKMETLKDRGQRIPDSMMFQWDAARTRLGSFG